ncbi:MAG TPA: ABC transporter ATP-binding protein [Candidatus Nitrosotalea sp.]|nr:ABC transporter ATP-binding protein [Candidatus Nitrosotalea sp.]
MTALLECQRVEFAYAPREVGAGAFAIRDLSFDVRAGETFGVIGPNASGKTTLVRLLSKVLEPSEGRILLEGEDLSGLSRPALARRVAVVTQDVPRGFPHTVEELVLMGRFSRSPRRFFESADDRVAARRAMEAVGVMELRGALLDRLSGGERQRAMLARALAQEPRLLVLDEPTAYLDLRYQAELAGLLRRLGREAHLTIVLVSHDLGFAAELSDRLLLMAGGTGVRIGPPEAVIDEALLEAAYGCRVIVDKHPISRRPTVHLIYPGGDNR